jgi:hypothetical protein
MNFKPASIRIATNKIPLEPALREFMLTGETPPHIQGEGRRFSFPKSHYIHESPLSEIQQSLRQEWIASKGDTEFDPTLGEQPDSYTIYFGNPRSRTDWT